MEDGGSDGRVSLALLWVAVGLTGAFGLFLILAPAQGLLLFGWIAFGEMPPVAGLPVTAHPYLMFLHGVLGAVMLGWAALIGLVLRAQTADPRWPLRAIALSVGLWFVVDTSWSLARGFPGNALLNLGFGLLFAVPLWRLWRSAGKVS
jgi:hypothetical protein